SDVPVRCVQSQNDDPQRESSKCRLGRSVSGDIRRQRNAARKERSSFENSPNRYANGLLNNLTLIEVLGNFFRERGILVTTVKKAGSVGELRGHPSGIAATISDALFLLLVIVNVIRTLRHAMWRDELAIFMVALHSSSPWSLLLNLKYEAHPALWYLL